METHRTKGDIIYLEPVICWVSAAARDGHTAHACTSPCWSVDQATLFIFVCHFRLSFLGSLPAQIVAKMAM